MLSEDMLRSVATSMAFAIAIDILTDEQAEIFEEQIGQMIAIFKNSPEPKSSQIVDMIDELNLIVEKFRYRHRILEDGGEVGLPSKFAGICHKCKEFPVEIMEPCPICGTRRWIHVLPLD